MKIILLICASMIIYLLVLCAGCWTVSTLTGTIVKLFKRKGERYE